ncbi:Transcription factor [Dirofilaria immitis]|nr:Transforming protein v-Fos/v-Fox [Dirofilaria immitis]
MSHSVANCNNNNNNNNNNQHHHRHQQSQQQQRSSNGVYNIVAISTCTDRINYPATLDDNIPSVGVSDSTSITNATDATEFDRSRQTRVIVAPNISSQQQQQSHQNSEESSSNSTLYGAITPSSSSSTYLTAQAGYLSGHTSVGQSSILHSSCSNSNFVYPSNFFQPYYGLSPTLNEFNVLQMCCQPLFTEIASQGTDITPTAESLYGFANRLHPITPTGAHYQLNMPQAYQTRTSFVGNTMTRPASATGKRGGRRPKEYEEYDHVTLSEEERDKRDKRRLRNKEAAARCRQRRLDLMGSLQNQVNQLKEENKMKDAKIAELQLLKNELIAVIRDHHCVLPEALRQTLDVDMSSTQQYMPRGAPAPVVTVPTSTEIVSYTSSAPSPQPALSSRKRPASAMIPDLRQPAPQPCASPLTSNVTLNRNDNQTNILTLTKPSSMQIKQEPTLFDVNGRDLPDEEIKRPTSLTFTDGVTTTTAYNSLSSSGVPITTPSNLIGGAASDFGGVNLLDGPTGLTPCHPPQATAFQLPSMAAPLGEGRSFETL